MFKWLTNLFKKEVEVVDEPVELIIFNRRGFKITMDKKTYNRMRELGYTFHLALNKGKPSCVHLKYRDKNLKKTYYVSSLKEWLDVKNFKDGNVCNFNPDNLELIEEE